MVHQQALDEVLSPGVTSLSCGVEGAGSPRSMLHWPLEGLLVKQAD